MTNVCLTMLNASVTLTNVFLKFGIVRRRIVIDDPQFTRQSPRLWAFGENSIRISQFAGYIELDDYTWTHAASQIH
jgi:hypothetical protein